MSAAIRWTRGGMSAAIRWTRGTATATAGWTRGGMTTTAGWTRGTATATDRWTRGGTTTTDGCVPGGVGWTRGGMTTTAGWTPGAVTTTAAWTRGAATATVGWVLGTVSSTVAMFRTGGDHAFERQMFARPRRHPGPVRLVAIARAHLPSPPCDDSRLRSRSILLARSDSHLLVHHRRPTVGPDRARRRVRRRVRQPPAVVLADLLVRTVRPPVLRTVLGLRCSRRAGSLRRTSSGGALPMARATTRRPDHVQLQGGRRVGGAVRLPLRGSLCIRRTAGCAHLAVQAFSRGTTSLPGTARHVRHRARPD
jgi:hypothetical protein